MVVLMLLGHPCKKSLSSAIGIKWRHANTIEKQGPCVSTLHPRFKGPGTALFLGSRCCCVTPQQHLLLKRAACLNHNNPCLPLNSLAPVAWRTRFLLREGRGRCNGRMEAPNGQTMCCMLGRRLDEVLARAKKKQGKRVPWPVGWWMC